MIGEILKAVINECQSSSSYCGGTILLKTDFKLSRISSYNMPLILIDMLESEDAGQYVGGLTRMDWKFALNSYNFEPDSTGDDPTDDSTNLLNVIDDLRTHFSIGAWITQGMTDILNSYGFRFTLSGVVPADALEGDGLVMGYRIVFDSVSFDQITSKVQNSTAELTNITQINNPPFN